MRFQNNLSQHLSFEAFAHRITGGGQRLGGYCQWVLGRCLPNIELALQPLGFDSLTLLGSLDAFKDA
jgi:hypothetical protein